jgi:DNA repair exonuclease SbcCD ATPase subunit
LENIEKDLQKKIQGLEKNLENANFKTEEMSRLLDTETNINNSLKQDVSDKEVYIQELAKMCQGYKDQISEFERIKSGYESESSKKDETIANLKAAVAKEKDKTHLLIAEEAEKKEDALDQVSRIESRLDVTVQELKRARSYAEEKENEILELKKLLRSQNKQLDSALGGSGARSLTSSEKKLADALSDVNVLSGQVTALKKELDAKDKEVFEVRVEAAEAFNKADKLAAAEKEIASLRKEIDDLIHMVGELKSEKGQLLEKIDNAEHRAEFARSQWDMLKAEMDLRSKQPPY